MKRDSIKDKILVDFYKLGQKGHMFWANFTFHTLFCVLFSLDACINVFRIVKNSTKQSLLDYECDKFQSFYFLFFEVQKIEYDLNFYSPISTQIEFW